MSATPAVTQTEEWLISTTLKERYGHDIELQHADADIRLSPSDRELTGCPATFWTVDG